MAEVNKIQFFQTACFSFAQKDKMILYYIGTSNIIIIIIIIIINLFIEGSLISAKALFCLRALFGATRIQSCMRMASWIRTRLSDLCTLREVGTFGEETFG